MSPSSALNLRCVRTLSGRGSPAFHFSLQELINSFKGIRRLAKNAKFSSTSTMTDSHSSAPSFLLTCTLRIPLLLGAAPL
jgi:hypothetical protein